MGTCVMCSKCPTEKELGLFQTCPEESSKKR